MKIIDFFKKNLLSNQTSQNYTLAEFSPDFFIGFDSLKNVVIVVKSEDSDSQCYKFSTKIISVECNAKVLFNNDTREQKVHILKCLSQSQKEKELFLELSQIFINNGHSSKNIIEVFNSLQMFFAQKTELSDNELTGFYAELYTIFKFHDSLQIEKFWQSRDRLKFDFSFSEKIKLEVKATTKENRIHHFRHEQLNSTTYEIYILSYLFRFDDEGLSLFDLIENVKPILKNEKDKYLRLAYIIKNTEEERLKKFKFDQLYTEEKMRFYNSKDVPKFNEQPPKGVSRAEYDCSFENVVELSTDTFLLNFTTVH